MTASVAPLAMITHVGTTAPTWADADAAGATVRRAEPRTIEPRGKDLHETFAVASASVSVSLSVSRGCFRRRADASVGCHPVWRMAANLTLGALCNVPRDDLS